MKKMKRLAVRLIVPGLLVPRSLRAKLLRFAGNDIGEDVGIRSGFRFIHGNITIGDGSFISDGCFFDDEAPIILGKRAGLGADVKLLSVSHPIGPSDARAGERHAKPITIGAGTWLGAGVTVLSGVTIGEGCVIGAGAVVIRDCEPNGMYAGVPAVRRRDLVPDRPTSRVSVLADAVGAGSATRP